MDKLKNKWSKIIGEPMIVLDVKTVNHEPHPFTIGPRHVGHAADHCGGMLGEESCKAHPCAARSCRLSYEEHIYDTVMFLQLTRDVTSTEVRAVLKPHCNEIEADGIGGFCFVETEQQYRITKN